MARKIFESYVTITAAAATGTAVYLDVDLPAPGDESDDGDYLVTAISDAALGTPVAVQAVNRIPISSPDHPLSYSMVPVGPALDVAAQSGNSQVVQGWLVGRSPAQLQITLAAAASASGGRVWVVVYAVGRRGTR